MKAKEPKNQEDRYLPRTNVREMICFEAGDESTHTKSPFINHFLRIFMEDVQSEKTIAERMGVTVTDIKAMLKVEAGTTFRELHDYWMAYRLNVALAMDPTLSGDALAKVAGFGNRSSAWAFYNSKRYKKIVQELDGVIFPEPHRQVHIW